MLIRYGGLRGKPAGAHLASEAIRRPALGRIGRIEKGDSQTLSVR
jgi:hypothetical protein